MDLITLQNTPPWEWPEETSDMLLDALTNGQADSPDRLVVVELAGEYTVINDKIAKTLMNIAKSNQEAEEVRGAAAIALGPALENADMMGFDDEDEVVISEEMFHAIQKSLQKLYMEADLPKQVRRRVLEASVHAPQPWHHEAVRVAYESKDDAWRLTAVFCMGFINGFEAQILDALGNSDDLIHYHAVIAAGNWEVDGAWDHIAGLVRSNQINKDLRIAAIGALAGIRPEEATAILNTLVESEDEDIVDAAFEALAMADGLEEIDGEFEYGDEGKKDDVF